MMFAKDNKHLVVVLSIGLLASTASAEWSPSGPAEPGGSWFQPFAYAGAPISVVTIRVDNMDGSDPSDASSSMLSGHFASTAQLQGFSLADWTLFSTQTFASDATGLPYQATAVSSTNTATSALDLIAHFDGIMTSPINITFSFADFSGGFSAIMAQRASYDGAAWQVDPAAPWQVGDPVIPVSAVPVPSAAVLAFIGLGGVTALRRKIA